MSAEKKHNSVEMTPEAEALMRLLDAYESGIKHWDFQLGAEKNIEREQNMERVFTEIELREIQPLYAKNDYEVLFTILQQYQDAYENSADKNSAEAIGLRAKYLHLKNLISYKNLCYTSPSAASEVQREALDLLDEYGDLESIPSLLKRRYLLAQGESIGIVISHDHNFALAHSRLKTYLQQLLSLDPDRYDTNGQIVVAYSYLGNCEMELGDFYAAMEAFGASRKKALENYLVPNSYFATYLNLLTLVQKQGTATEGILEKTELILKYLDMPPAELADEGDPMAVFLSKLIQGDQNYASLVRGELEKTLLGCKLQLGGSDTRDPDYQAQKQAVVGRWDAEYVQLLADPDLPEWVKQNSEREITTRRADLLLMEARAGSPDATEKYYEVIDLYEEAELHFHAAETGFEMIAGNFTDGITNKQIETFLMNYWRFVEENLDQKVFIIFGEEEEKVAKIIKNIAETIRSLYPNENDFLSLQKALRKLSKLIIRQHKDMQKAAEAGEEGLRQHIKENLA